MLRPSGTFFLYYIVCSFIVLSYLILSCLIFSYLLQSFRLSCYLILYHSILCYITFWHINPKTMRPETTSCTTKPLIETVGCHSPGKPTRSNMFFQKCKGGRRKGAAHFIFSSEADTQTPNIHPENPQFHLILFWFILVFWFKMWFILVFCGSSGFSGNVWNATGENAGDRSKQLAAQFASCRRGEARPRFRFTRAGALDEPNLGARGP